LEQAQENRIAISHFNVANLVLLKPVLRAAHELKVPVIIGVSEAEREFIGVRQIAALVRSWRDEFDFPIS
jgi:fructose-bisphosphate aldolase, class II